MKTSIKISSKLKTLTLLLSIILCPIVQSMAASPMTKERKIQIALILDTSGSMDGLIEQAKSQLWLMVSELTKATYDGADPLLEIALYEYGNDGISSKDGYIRQISSLVSDLDDISASLFSLSTNGGSEFCGMVIQKSLKELEWSRSDKDIKMIFIAGNEPFTQGSIDYQIACGNAREKGIMINTIHCGSYEEGIRGQWKSGALIGGGDYMAIEQNKKTIYIATPYDDRINELSTALNTTYIYYGSKGKIKKQEQIIQDQNAASYSSSNMATRSSIKASKFYRNSSWDLIDAYEDESVQVKDLDKSNLAPSLQNKSDEELEAYVQEQLEKRNDIKAEIAALNHKRSLYLAHHESDKGESLESSMIKAIRKQALSKNYTW